MLINKEKKQKKSLFLSDFLLVMRLRKEKVCYNCENSENDSADRCITCKLLFFCLALIFAEEGIAGRTADCTGKTVLFGALEKNEHDDGNRSENDKCAENVAENCIHYYKPPIRRMKRRFFF